MDERRAALVDAVAGLGVAGLDAQVAGDGVGVAVVGDGELVDAVRLAAAEFLHVRVAQFVVLGKRPGDHVEAALDFQRLLFRRLGHVLGRHDHKAHQEGEYLGKQQEVAPDAGQGEAAAQQGVHLFDGGKRQRQIRLFRRTLDDVHMRAVEHEVAAEQVAIVARAELHCGVEVFKRLVQLGVVVQKHLHGGKDRFQKQPCRHALLRGCGHALTSYSSFQSSSGSNSMPIISRTLSTTPLASRP